MTDYFLWNEIAELSRRMCRPRLIHAKGVGAYGTFRPYMSMEDYTDAAFLKKPEVITPVFVRFSKTFGACGSGDSTRDSRGFAVRFFTKAGECDLICQSFPVYYIKDPDKFPALIDVLGSSVDKGLTDEKRFWHFFAENPEVVNITLWLFSDRGTIKSYRKMEGYSINTFKWSSSAGGDEKSCFVRLKWSPFAGIETIRPGEAEFLAGFAPDTAAEDLYEAIESGNYPAYELQAQMISQEEMKELEFDILDPTLLWPEERFSYIKVGQLVLNYLPKDYLNEVEKTEFCPANLPQGMSLSGDRFTETMIMAHRDGAGHRKK